MPQVVVEERDCKQAFLDKRGSTGRRLAFDTSLHALSASRINRGLLLAPQDFAANRGDA
jgi:hypothetical protein